MTTVLKSSMAFTECPIENIDLSLAYDARDWSANTLDAWIYGIVVGWDDEAIEELKLKFEWEDETVTRLKALHEACNDLREHR